MKTETKRRLRAMSDTEREKRLDELNRKLGITQRNELVETDKQEMEEREWLKEKLGYKALNKIGTDFADYFPKGESPMKVSTVVLPVIRSSVVTVVTSWMR